MRICKHYLIEICNNVYYFKYKSLSISFRKVFLDSTLSGMKEGSKSFLICIILVIIYIVKKNELLYGCALYVIINELLGSSIKRNSIIVSFQEIVNRCPDNVLL